MNLITIRGSCGGGERVVNGISSGRCTYCTHTEAGPICIAAFQACHVPLPEPAKPARRISREATGRWIGGTLGLGGVVLFAIKACNYFF